MSEKIINFSMLKKRDIKALIYTVEGDVKTEYNQDKIVELQEKLEHPILIYNPNNKQKIEMQNLVREIGNKSLEKKIDFIIEAKDLVLKFLPLCTNVILDLDFEKDKELIEEIIENPSDEFNAIIYEVTKITKLISQSYIKAIRTFSELPKEKLEEIIKESIPELNEKEKKKIELEKQQLEIQKQIEELSKENNIEIKTK